MGDIRRRASLAVLLLTTAVGTYAADETTADEAATEAAAAADELEADEIFVEDALDRTPQDCISTNRIRKTDVIDDRTIVFWMRGGDVYTNLLERDCPGLGRHKRFMHETRGGRLCEIDTITVLEQWAGRIAQGFTCGLGEFHPITEIEAQDLVVGPDEAAASSNDIEVKEVELPPGEDEPAETTDEEPAAD